jgi:nucleoside-diphosphate-sugar epimerase
LINIFISGANGFVGSNWIAYTNKVAKYNNMPIKRDEDICPQRSIVYEKSILLHLAGKAHDTRKVLNPQVYYEVNTVLTKKIFDDFLVSQIDSFIMISSVKAVADVLEGVLTEDYIPSPNTHYGKSKLLAEQYILSKQIPLRKKVYILRPCMIHGPGNKGNLNLLYKLVSKGIPWPLGSFDNKRSFCSIDNLMFIIKELIEREDIPSGVYNVADDEALSTNDVISILAESQNKKPKILDFPKGLIQFFSKLGDLFRLPLTTERLQKLTESYLVCNQKIKSAIGKDLPVSAKDGLIKTFNSFQTNVN